MENINAGSIYKLASVKWLLVTLLIGFSCGVFAEQQQFSFKKQKDSFVVFEANGKWENSAAINHETELDEPELSGGQNNSDFRNPRFKFKVLKKGAVDIKLLEPNKPSGCLSYIDTYVYLLKDGKSIARNDDYDAWAVGTFNHSFVSITEATNMGDTFCRLNSGIAQESLEPGNYEVVAGTYLDGLNGSFRLFIGAEEGVIENTKIIRKDFKQSGKWISPGGQDRFSDGNKHYEFTLTNESEVIIDLTSLVDTYLFLLTSNGDIIEVDDDGGTGYSSKIERKLPAGTYRLVAATYRSGSGSAGAFELKLNASQGYLKDFQEFQKENNQKLKSPTVFIDNKEIDGLYKWSFDSNKEYIKVKIKNNNSVTGTTIAEISEEVDKEFADIYQTSNEEFKIYPKKSGFVGYWFYTKVAPGYQAAPGYDNSDRIYLSIWIKKGDQRDIFKEDRKEVTLGDSNFALEVNSKGKYQGEINSYYVDSHDSDIVEVDDSGVVEIKKAGSAFINVTRSETDRYYKAIDSMMIVVNRLKQEVKFDQNIREVKWDYQYDVADFLDKKGETALTYSISNDKAKVNKQGKLVILKHVGTFKITATATATDLYDSAEATVTLTIQKGTRTLSVADINSVYSPNGPIQPVPKFNNDSDDATANDAFLKLFESIF